MLQGTQIWQVKYFVHTFVFSSSKAMQFCFSAPDHDEFATLVGLQTLKMVLELLCECLLMWTVQVLASLHIPPGVERIIFRTLNTDRYNQKNYHVAMALWGRLLGFQDLGLYGWVKLQSPFDCFSLLRCPSSARMLATLMHLVAMYKISWIYFGDNNLVVMFRRTSSCDLFLKHCPHDLCD